MSTPNPYLNIIAYNKILRIEKKYIVCPDCQFELLPKDFEKHCLDEHNLHPKYLCVWCHGQFTWKKGAKYNHADHLTACFERFKTSHSLHSRASAAAAAAAASTSSASVTVPPPVLLDLSPLCEARQFFGHASLMHLLPPRAFDFVWPRPFEPLRLRFRDDTLNAAAAYVRQYLAVESGAALYWVHAMVKACAFDSFLRAMDEAGGAVTALPFSCWCDGGPHPAARFRQHRHLILVSTLDEAAFKIRFWQKVKVARGHGLSPRFPCKRLKKIESALHLVNAMGYVSKRESRCKFSFDSLERRDRLNHFYILRTLPKDHKLPLVLGWDGGVLELLRRETLKNVSLAELIEAAEDGSLEFSDGKYRRRIRHFIGDRRLGSHLVLPVAKRFAPKAAAANASETTVEEEEEDLSLHLFEGRKLEFDSDPRRGALGEEEWLRMQAERGNRFYDLLGDDLHWTPRPQQQAFLGRLVPLVRENADLRRRLEATEATLKASEDERASLERQNERLQLQVSRFQNEDLLREIERLKRTIEETRLRRCTCES